MKMLSCGHACGGVRDEATHPPCLACEDEHGDVLVRTFTQFQIYLLIHCLLWL
jgi:hypothetical protein